MKKNLFCAFAVCALFCACAPQITEPIKSGGKSTEIDLLHSENANINKKFAKFNAAGELEITTASNGWTQVFKMKDGLLEPEKNYTLKIECELEKNQPEDCFLHIIVRNSKNFPASSDILYHNEYEQSRRSLSLDFSTPPNCANYSLSIHTPRPTKARIYSIKLMETQRDFYPITSNTARYTGKLGKLPTGAKEFEVELPNPKNGIEVNAKDFGLSPSCPDPQDAINKAIAHCKKIGASKLIVERGTYFINKDGSIVFDGIKDLTFDANGSTFIYNKMNGTNLRIKNCERVKFCNFNFDWDWENDPLGSIVEVVANEKSPQPHIDIKFIDYKRFPRRDVRIAVMSSYDPTRKAVGVENQPSAGFEVFRGRNVPKTEWLSDNVLRIYGDVSLPVGTLYRIQHSYYEMGGVTLDDNTNLTMENVNIYGCSGCAFVIGGTQKYWQLVNVNVISPKGRPLRPITTTADHLHITNSCGFGKLINCEFERGADDCINMHDCSAFARKIGDKTVRTQNCPRIYNYSKGDLVELRQGDFSPSGFKSKISSIKTISEGVHDITFEDNVPEQLFDGFILFNWKYDTRNMILRNCYFHDNKARAALVLCRDVTIENCRFEHNEIGAIHIETGYTFNVWSEGYGVDNVVFRNCAFDGVNPTNRKIGGKVMDVYMGVYMKTDPTSEHTQYPILSNILFESNTFKDTYGLVAIITSTSNVTWLNNTFINETERKNKFSYRGCFYISHSQNTRIINNTYVESPWVPNPGVYVDPTTSKDILVAGNKVVKNK